MPENEEYTIPIGKAVIRRAGTDVTIVTYNKMVIEACYAAMERPPEPLFAGPRLAVVDDVGDEIVDGALVPFPDRLGQELAEIERLRAELRGMINEKPA